MFSTVFELLSNFLQTFIMLAFLSVFTMAIVFVIASVVIHLGTCISGLTVSHHVGTLDVWRFVLVIIAGVVEVVVFRLIIHVKNDYELAKREWLVFVSLPLMVWINTIIFTNTSIEFPETVFYMMLAETMPLMLFLN